MGGFMKKPAFTEDTLPLTSEYLKEHKGKIVFPDDWNDKGFRSELDRVFYCTLERQPTIRGRLESFYSNPERSPALRILNPFYLNGMTIEEIDKILLEKLRSSKTR